MKTARQIAEESGLGLEENIKKLELEIKEYAREALKEQRKICANQIRTRFDILENVEKVKTAPEPELK